jgi:hypothetical protein
MAAEKDDGNKKPDAPEVAMANERAEAEKAHAAATADGSKAKSGFTVAKGLSITSARGILEEGQPVAASDFGPGDKGKAALDDLVARGAIVKS